MPGNRTGEQRQRILVDPGLVRFDQVGEAVALGATGFAVDSKRLLSHRKTFLQERFENRLLLSRDLA